VGFETKEIGSFMDNVKPPLTIGNLVLEDGKDLKECRSRED